MKSVKLSAFIRMDPKPFVCGILLSRIMETTIGGKNYFYAYCDYKTSNYVYPDDFNFENYANEYVSQLNSVSGYHNWEVVRSSEKRVRLEFKILCDIDNFSKNMLYDYIFKKTLSSDWALEENQNDEKKYFIRGFVEPRGSIDTTAKFIAQDYFYDSEKELKKCKILTDIMNIDINYANFNSRETQPQYVNDENKRNTQFRINLFYYANRIGFMNKYKAKVFENVYVTNPDQARSERNGILYYSVDVPTPRSADARFIAYLNYYTNNIYNQNITDSLLQRIRRDLGFSDSNTESENRNHLIIRTFDEVSPDKCACCGTTQTYTKNNGRQYFEIHHVVPFANGIETDNIANLVKLCPTCHRMMKKGSGQTEEQIAACKKFITEHEEIYEFTSSILDEEDKDRLAIKIQELLK